MLRGRGAWVAQNEAQNEARKRVEQKRSAKRSLKAKPRAGELVRGLVQISRLNYQQNYLG
jgi:predicted RNA-binding protein YlxR (DUF448 family)